MGDRPWAEYTPHHDADHRAGILAEWGVVDESDTAWPAYVAEGYRDRALDAEQRVQAARDLVVEYQAEIEGLRALLTECCMVANVRDPESLPARIRSLRARGRRT